LGQAFNSRSDYMDDMNLSCCIQIRPNLELKTWTEQLFRLSIIRYRACRIVYICVPSPKVAKVEQDGKQILTIWEAGYLMGMSLKSCLGQGFIPTAKVCSRIIPFVLYLPRNQGKYSHGQFQRWFCKKTFLM
jgi:glycopeptide antibiotics resistance protein